MSTAWSCDGSIVAFRSDRAALEAKVRALQSENEELREQVHEHAKETANVRRALEDMRDRLDGKRSGRSGPREVESPAITSTRAPDPPRVAPWASLAAALAVSLVGAATASNIGDRWAVLGFGTGLLFSVLVWWVSMHTNAEKGRPFRTKWTTFGSVTSSLVMTGVCVLGAREGPIGIVWSGVLAIAHSLAIWVIYRSSRPPIDPLKLES